MGLSFPGTGMQVDKLWENSNPNAAFASQKVSMDLSAYDAVLIFCSYNTILSNSKIEFAFVGAAVSIQVFSFGDKMPGTVRNAQVQGNGVVFSDAYYYQWNTQSYVLNNEGSIPISIYGVKF